jgi:hypothetical protein
MVHIPTTHEAREVNMLIPQCNPINTDRSSTNKYILASVSWGTDDHKQIRLVVRVHETHDHLKILRDLEAEIASLAQEHGIGDVMVEGRGGGLLDVFPGLGEVWLHGDSRHLGGVDHGIAIHLLTSLYHPHYRIIEKRQ